MGALVAGFEKKYGLKTTVWRAGSEKVLQRAVTEARGNRHTVDIIETNGPEMESMHREKILTAVKSPYLAQLIPQALRPHALLLEKHLQQLPLHSVAQLLLTTALATRPDTLPHAVTAMALAGAMACGRNALVDTRLAMLGGLLHDLGEVYIQPQYLDGATALDLVGHKHLVVHPRVAQMMLGSITDYPETLCRAIGEHHERLDGSGYPARLAGPECSELGRLLAVVEVTVGILRGGRSPLTRASFALRVVPGEFDPQWASFVCNLARAAEEAVPDDMLAPAGLQNSPLALIEQRIERARQVLTTLQGQGRSGPILQIVETALARLGRLQVMQRVVLDPPELGAQEQPHRRAAVVQVAGDDEAVAAVVAGTGDDQDLAAVQIHRAPVVELPQHLDDTAAGALHQHAAGNADLGDRLCIQRAHLLGRDQGDHGRPPLWVGPAPARHRAPGGPAEAGLRGPEIAGPRATPAGVKPPPPPPALRLAMVCAALPSLSLPCTVRE